MKPHQVGWLSVLLVTVTATAALGAPGGELDAGFGQNGRIVMDLGGSSAAIAQQPDGKLVIAGAIVGDDERTAFAVLRLEADGLPDEGFGTQGVSVIGFDDIGSYASVLMLQPDGKIVAAGGASKDPARYDLAVARLNTDGSVDETFNTDGRAGFDLQWPVLDVSDVALSEYGGILIAASDAVGTVVLARLTADGLPDTTPGTEAVPGATLVDVGASLHSIRGAARQVDGKYVICGASLDSSDWWWTGNMKALRLNEDGSLDTDFGSNGVWQLEDDVDNDSAANSCVVTPDEHILLAGRLNGNAALVKVRADGITDTAAWPSGLGSIPLGSSGEAQSVSVLADGDLAVTGNIYTGSSNIFVARVDSISGSLDPDFGDRGVTVIDFGHGDLYTSVLAEGLIEQSDGKLVALSTVWNAEIVGDFSGDENSTFALARVDPSGPGHNGFVGFAYPINSITEETDDEFPIAVQRTGGSAGSYVVDYQTRADSAAPPDYSAASGTLVWADGETGQKLINVRVTEDRIFEPTERFHVDLFNPSGALARDSTTVLIFDELTYQANQNYSSGGGGAFGVDVLLLGLIWVAGLIRNRSVPVLRR